MEIVVVEHFGSNEIYASSVLTVALRCAALLVCVHETRVCAVVTGKTSHRTYRHDKVSMLGVPEERAVLNCVEL